MRVLLTEGSSLYHVMGFGSGSVVFFGESEAFLDVTVALASAMSLLRCCNSSVVGSDALRFGGFGRG